MSQGDLGWKPLMHKFLPSIVIVVTILMMLSLSVLHTFAEQRSTRLVLSSKASGTSTTSVRIKEAGGSAKIVTPPKKETRSARTRRIRPLTPTPTGTYTLTPTQKLTKAPPQPIDPQTGESSPHPTKEQPKTPAASGGDDVQLSDEQKYIMQAINDYRASQGLSVVKPDRYTCDFAATRAQEIADSFSHDGFRQRIDAETLPYPSYTLVAENIARTSDYASVVPMWIESSGHAENMRKDSPYVCVVRNEDFYAYESWKP